MRYEIIGGCLELQTDPHSLCDLAVLDELAEAAEDASKDVSFAQDAPGGSILSFALKPLMAPPPQWPNREGEWQHAGTVYLVMQVPGDPTAFVCRLLRDNGAAWRPVRLLERGAWEFKRPLSAFVGDVTDIQEPAQ